ncbi:hypothetical protein F5Y16DRAFT_409907 [Xylariaceae sp. FL0255]|nr:hypothetical protein F5Y16DRAFT_409907 [Xylariaceae sp. FL0255]
MQRELEIIKNHVNGVHSTFGSPHTAPEWQLYPEIPSAEDLNVDFEDPVQRDGINNLLPNTWDRPWSAKNTYLETHYRLQREEAIATLRFSIHKYRTDPKMVDDDETCVYTKVFVRGYLMTIYGPAIKWKQTRRLNPGSLIALSTVKDGFRRICIPAVIADHKLYWADLAIRHCMEGLKHVANNPSVLDKYLVDLDKSDQNADYVQNTRTMNISSLVHHIPGSQSMPRDEVDQHYEILNDNSQLSAVHRILTKELSIIQGPPGTGKTFTQPVRGKNVIIVAAQTNHAVDQILLQLIQLGVQTIEKNHSSQKNFRTIDAARNNNNTQLQKLLDGITSVTPESLRDAGLISDKQFQSVTNDEIGWEGDASTENSPSDDDPATPLWTWLADQRVEAPATKIVSPLFEDQESDDNVDLDENEFDIELDDCIDEEDDKRGLLYGKWIPIRQKWTGANPRKYTEKDLAVRRELKKSNLHDIPKTLRGAVYQYWQRELLQLKVKKFREILKENARLCKNLKTNKWHRDLHCIRAGNIEVIGCTTTGLCKYRGLLAALEPRTMLIEEAAETKEANILSALYPSLQQLILVGDHQQLAPQCGIPNLEDPPYFLRVSMFERLVKNDMPFTMLNMQRRMSADLRALLSPFYSTLQDHPVVTAPQAHQRKAIPGVPHTSYFFSHLWSESTDENMSKYNVLEAEMVVRFIGYLLMNEVDASLITVLTFYRGQRRYIINEYRKKFPHRLPPFKNVQTVDSYQGEENDIIILSLVRGNGLHGPHRAGFLRDSNRGVVAISRARRGFYIFGNYTNLDAACDESRYMWGSVAHVLLKQGRFGRDATFPIECQNHRNTTVITHPEDWIGLHGGCRELCGGKFECGHTCPRHCHWTPHSKLICLAPCEKTLRCGHPCQEHCGNACKCDCPQFTGAYLHDGTWDDRPPTDALLRTAPFVGLDGRVGRVHENGDQQHTAGPGLGILTAQTFARVAASTDHPSTPWLQFNPQKTDAMHREARLQAMAPRLIKSSISGNPSQADRNRTAHYPEILETFRQVTLTDAGERNGIEPKWTTTQWATTPRLVGTPSSQEATSAHGNRATPWSELRLRVSNKSKPNGQNINAFLDGTTDGPDTDTNSRVYTPSMEITGDFLRHHGPSVLGPIGSSHHKSHTERSAKEFQPEWHTASVAGTDILSNDDDRNDGVAEGSPSAKLNTLYAAQYGGLDEVSLLDSEFPSLKPNQNRDDNTGGTDGDLIDL